MKLYLSVFFSLFASLLIAQDFPTPIIGHAFCKPGVRNSAPSRGLSVEYILHPKYNFQSEIADKKDESSVDSKDRMDVKVKIPLLNGDQNKILLGFYYSFEKYDFINISPPDNFLLTAIDDVLLKRTRFTAYYLRSLDDRKYLAFRFGASYNGDYSGLVDFDNRYAVYRVAGILGLKKEDDREIGIGILVNSSFRRTLAYPFVTWSQTFTDKWGISTVLPVKFMGRYNISDGNVLQFGAEYYSSAYSIDAIENPEQPTDYHFKSSAVQFSVELNKRLFSKWTWMALKAGFAWNFDSAFIEKADRDNRIDAAPSNSVFVSVTFFLSPPKDF